MKLKNFFYVLILLSATITSRAQYLPLTSSSHLWSLVEIHCLPGYNTYSSKYYAFKGDTVIGETVYKKFYASDNSNPTQWYLWGFFREDTALGKVWYRSIFPESEGIAYDFSAHTGDTLFVHNPVFSSEPIMLFVQQTTLIEIGGEIRRQHTMWEPEHNQSEVWIEGIGSLYGIKNSGMSWSGAACGSEELLCFWDDEIKVYQNPVYETCFIEYTGKETLPDVTPSIHFNPANKVLSVSTLNHSSVLKIYNLMGQEFLQISLYGPSTFSMSALSKGFYVVRLIEPNRVSARIISMY